MNILVHTWWFSKNKGSEFAVSYNFVKEMSKRHHLYVLVESNSYMWNDLSEFDGGGYSSMANVDFIALRYKTNRVLKYLCSHFSLGWLSYGLFKGWEKNIYRYIKNSGLLEKIDLIHFAAPVGYREPGYLWKLNKPYVWGPFGGMYRIPKEFLDSYPLKANILGRIKNVLNFCQFHSFRIKKIFNKSNVLIACTKTQSGMVNKLLNNECCRYLPENGIDLRKQQSISDEFLTKKFNSPFINIIWIGCNDNRKNAKLLMKALQKCKSENFSCTFVGKCCSDLKKLVYGNNELKQRLSFIEHIPREAVLEMYKNAHLMAITSSMEANTTVLFEAMENCVPVITVDHCGMADVVKNDESGIKIKVQNQEKMAEEFALKIDELCKNPAKLLTFARNIKTSSYEYSQKYRMDFFDKCYEDAIKKFEGGKK